jgi:hypothetical protein
MAVIAKKVRVTFNDGEFFEIEIKPTITTADGKAFGEAMKALSNKTPALTDSVTVHYVEN